jgi:DNA modification methylase
MTYREEIIGDARLILGDCRDARWNLGADDACVTDPPYGIGAAKKNAHSSIRDNDAWVNADWDDGRPPASIFRRMLLAREVAIWGGNYFADMLPASSAWLAWVKPQADTGFSLADMELCWTNLGFAARTKRLPRRDGNDHPSQKPIEVMEWCVRHLPEPAGLVCDPFMGSGTTGVACANLGRRFIGIEREPAYFDIACKRIEAAYRQPRLFAEPVVKPVQPSLLGDAA